MSPPGGHRSGGQESGNPRRSAAGCIVIVMAKAPIAGYAKSRLAPRLGAGGAAALAERLLVHAVQQAASAGFDAVELCASPDPSHPAFQRLEAQHRLRLSCQGAGDLGERMHRALERALATHARAILIGTDAPALDSRILRRADAALTVADTVDTADAADATAAADAADAVFVPAHDGGYALVGMRRPIRALFEGIDWSTDRVMRQTRERAASCGARLAELPSIADIDKPEDLVHLPPDWLT